MSVGNSEVLTQAIARASLTGDQVIIDYRNSLSESQRNSEVRNQISGLVNNVLTRKRSEYLDNADKLRGADTNAEAAMYYLSRTKDLHDLAKDTDEVTLSQLDVLNVNSGLSVRQNEINEWSNQNKLDTLFFLQTLFIGLCLIAFVLFLKVSGIVPTRVFIMVTIIVGILIVLTFILRHRFTSVSRDSRYWNKARFPKQADENTSSSSSSSTSTR